MKVRLVCSLLSGLFLLSLAGCSPEVKDRIMTDKVPPPSKPLQKVGGSGDDATTSGKDKPTSR
jgi:hypothetical protein